MVAGLQSVTAASVSACRAAARLTTVRAASTVSSAQREVYSPAVASLIGRHQIREDVLANLPRSGPKNRLLKGDLLRFLADPSAVGTAAMEEDIPTADYGKTITVNELVTYLKNYNDQKGTHISVSDLFARAAYLALAAVPEVNARWIQAKKAAELIPISELVLIRQSTLGVSTMTLKEPEDVGGAKIAKQFKDQGSSPNGIFSIHDSVLSPFDGIPPSLTNESALLTIGPIEKIHRSTRRSSSATDNVFSYLAGVPNPRAPASTIELQKNEKPSKIDEIDILSQSAAGFFTGSTAGECEPRVEYVVEVDLLVDSRAVSAKTSGAFLGTWEALLKEPSVLI
ncbi:hypothetical protein BC832DRAFT_567960 [Gaertneriomyces semiglobifer]|nr:hypothetical protein BC832DRAFT_567960 [Gaertneriomyces semiglobifer]